MRLLDQGRRGLSNASNSYGNTTIVQGTLSLGVTNAIPTGGVLKLGAALAANNQYLDLNGKNQEVAGLTTGVGTDRFVTNLSSSNSVFTVNNSSADYSFAGTLYRRREDNR